MSIRFDCKIKAKHNFKNINNISKQLPQFARKVTEDILKSIRGYAIKLEKGHNEEGILCELIDISNNEIKGRIYAKPEEFMTDSNISYLWFEYFGTGEYAEMEHIGKTKHFIESGFTEWLIPINKVPTQLNYVIITIQGQQFYLAHGVKSNHFLEDAEFKSRTENENIVKKSLSEMIKEACK